MLACGLLSLTVGLASGLLSLTVDLTSGLLSLTVGLASVALSAHKLCIRETRRSRTHFFLQSGYKIKLEGFGGVWKNTQT